MNLGPDAATAAQIEAEVQKAIARLQAKAAPEEDPTTAPKKRKKKKKKDA